MNTDFSFKSLFYQHGAEKDFRARFDSYTYLAQQREVQDISKETMIWGKEEITKRKEKITEFIMTHI